MFLPLFPMKLVVFPGEKLKLHIFEPRYRQLILECKESGMGFGIPAYIDGGVSEFGTEVRLLTVFSTQENGDMDILTEGRHPFRLDRFLREVPGKLYCGGEVTPIQNEEDAAHVDRRPIIDHFLRFHELLGTGYTRENFDGPNLSYELAQEVGLPLSRKVELLSLSRESERLSLLEEHLRRAVPMLVAAQETRERVRRNGKFRKMEVLEL